MATNLTDLVVSGGTTTATLTLGSTSLANVLLGAGSGYKLARGSQIATATALVATGLATVVAFAITPIAASTTTIRAAAFASAKAAATAGSINVYRWKYTSATNTAVVAATTAGTLSWIAVGT